MTTLKDIEQQIVDVTTTIETDYPELYPFLSENPTTIPASKHPHITMAILQDYLESLKQLLKHHIESRKQKP